MESQVFVAYIRTVFQRSLARVRPGHSSPEGPPSRAHLRAGPRASRALVRPKACAKGDDIAHPEGDDTIGRRHVPHAVRARLQLQLQPVKGQVNNSCEKSPFLATGCQNVVSGIRNLKYFVELSNLFLTSNRQTLRPTLQLQGGADGTPVYVPQSSNALNTFEKVPVKLFDHSTKSFVTKEASRPPPSPPPPPPAPATPRPPRKTTFGGDPRTKSAASIERPSYVPPPPKIPGSFKVPLVEISFPY